MGILPSSQRNQVLLVVIMLSIGAMYAFYQFRWVPVNDSLTVMQTHVDSLDVWNQRAKVEMSKGTEKQLLQQAAKYQQSLAVMRQLVPTGNEVPTLLEQVSTAARRVGLDVADIQPQPVIPGEQFDTYRYTVRVLGDYHTLAEFMTNVGSLTRIIAPVNVRLTLPSNAERAKKLKRRKDDSIIEAQFDIQTYVAKNNGPPPAAGTAAGATGAAGAAGANE
jgi:type IV pilus assembly protein PilO